MYFRQKANVLHIQRASQINETSNPVEKMGKEYEQNWAKNSHRRLHTWLLIIGKNVQPYSQ